MGVIFVVEKSVHLFFSFHILYSDSSPTILIRNCTYTEKHEITFTVYETIS